MCCVFHLLPEIHQDIRRFFCALFSPFSSESVAEPLPFTATSASQCDFSGRKISIKLILWRKWKQNFSASGVSFLAGMENGRDAFEFFQNFSWDFVQSFPMLSETKTCFNLKNVKYKKLVIILNGQTENSHSTESGKVHICQLSTISRKVFIKGHFATRNKYTLFQTMLKILRKGSQVNEKTLIEGLFHGKYVIVLHWFSSPKCSSKVINVLQNHYINFTFFNIYIFNISDGLEKNNSQLQAVPTEESKTRMLEVEYSIRNYQLSTPGSSKKAT